MKKIILSVFALIVVFSVNAQSRLTPELMWKLGRVNEMQVSPDGKTVLYTITYYNLEENKGNTDIYSIPSLGGIPIKLTDTKTSEFNIL